MDGAAVSRRLENGTGGRGRQRPLSRPLCAAMLSTESRSADTVCPAGTAYSEILNSFREMPLRALGDFHTTIRMIFCSFH